MTEFESWRSYWQFARSVRTKHRYLHADSVKHFLKVVLETGRKRATVIPKGAILWRSQLGVIFVPMADSDMEEERPFPPERMIPQQHSAKEGRVNPKGIPCLYLSTDMETALSEVRPWVGSSISLGRFKTVKSLKVIDFSKDDSKNMVFYFNGKEPSPEERERDVWKYINRAFSTPVTPNDEQADYVPTQILAELFKSNGYDGLVYKSSCGLGHNIALFEIDSAKMLNGRVCTAESVRFVFDKNTRPYYR